MVEKLKIRWVYLISAIYIVVNSILMANEFFWFSLLPAFALLFILYFFALDKLLLLITFLTPLAVILRVQDFGIGISLPSEPLLLGILLLFFLKMLYDNDFDIRITKHPISILIFLNLSWLFLTCITSEIPLVSFKFLLARLWFVVPFFFIASQVFRNYKNIKTFIWLYIIPLLGVIFYTLYNHSLYSFEEEPGHWVMTPFYNDHTAYGAVIALLIPITAGFFINKAYNHTIRFFSLITLIILITAIIFSYSRAAWISVAFSAFVFIIIILKIRFWVVLSGAILIILIFFSFQHEILLKLEKNKQESSAHFIEHVQSISNISSDASNLERINRWQSAFRMFHERPFWGWGPGTYQFIYAPFQYSQEKTIISTNAGDRGNAHSEYIGPLAEAGVLGMLTFLAIVFYVIYTGVKVYRNAVTTEIKIISISLLMGLVSYFMHGLLNNFLDTDKASVPFWGFISILVAMDVYHNRNGQKAGKKL